MKSGPSRAGRSCGVALCLLLLLAVVPVSADVHYVSLSGADLWPYTNWADAATSIQPAIDAASPGDTVLVSNGTYSVGQVVVGSNIASRIAITNAITVQSVNGPTVTTIDGDANPTRCVYIGTNGTLIGFTLANGWADVFGSAIPETSGGGLMCEGGLVFNCRISNNRALNGGGVLLYNGGALRNCLIVNNRCNASGAGVYCYYGGSLQNCTIATNMSNGGNGGGVGCEGGGTVENTIIYGNSAYISGTNWYNLGSNMSYRFSCTTPAVPGTSNISANPLFINPGVSNYRLQMLSPCIDMGSNQAWMAAAADLDGTNRLMNNLVDIGAYEYVFYDIVATAGVNGAIAPSGTIHVARTASTNFTIIADPNYHVSNVLVDAVAVGPTNSYTFSNVTSNHTIDAFFAIDVHTLIVATDHGTAVPPAGTNVYDYGTTVTCSIVDSPVLNGTTQYVCTGWNGAGSVPANGFTTNVTITVTNDSSVTWQWQTNYWLNAASDSNGSVSVTGGWFKASTNVTVTAIPSNGYHFLNWTGDISSSNNPLVVTMSQPYAITANFAINWYSLTAAATTNGSLTPTGVVWVAYGGGTNYAITPAANYHISNVVVDATNSIGPTNSYIFLNVATNHTISAVFAIDTYTLAVSTAYGTASPSGTNLYDYGTNLTCSVSSVVPNGTTQYVCIGWVGSGSVPPAGTSNSVDVTVTNDSWLTWQWETNYLLHPVAGPDGSVSLGDGWYTPGAGVTITATPSPRATFAGWTGDFAPADSNNTVLSLTMDRSRAVTANFLVTTHYVATNGGHVAPYTNWVQAATNIQDAVTACEDGARVLVSNGVYRLSAPVTITNGIRIESVGGAGLTTLDGNDSVGCLWSANPSNVVDGFTITRGWAADGGGLRLIGGTARNCIITGNTATNGGGVHLSSNGVLRSCLVAGNTALGSGGGLWLGDSGTVQNCTLASNTAFGSGGGVYGVTTSTVRDCIIYFNAAPTGTNYALSGATSCTYNCSVPLMPGAGNLTNNPQLTPTGRLKTSSPCIDGGTTNGAPATDLERRSRWDDPRHSAGPSSVDIGAFEFTDIDLDSMDDYWEIAQFGGTNNSNGAGDPDADGLTDLQEYENSFSPTNRTTYGDSLNDLWKATYGFTQPHVLEPLRSGDSDQDGLLDSWETNWFGNLAQGATNDFDVDSVSNWGERLLALNPTNTDSDVDGLNDGAEVNTTYTDPRVSDTDADGFSDGSEIALATDPRNPASFPATISGTVVYTGALPGTVRITATNSGTFASNSIAAPGAYSISNRPTLTNYWVTAYRDSNSNGVRDLWEAEGSYSNNPVLLTNNSTGINITLVDPLFGFDVAGNPLQLGSPTPYGYTPNTLTSYTVITNRVAASVVNGTTQYICTGWTGTGSAPTSGVTTNVTVILTNDTTLTWNWQASKFYLDVQAGPSGTVSGTSGWYAVNAVITNTVSPSNGYHFAGWTGDVPPAQTNDTTLALLLDQARVITANFAINVYDVTSSAGANGSIVPNGIQKVAHGGSTNFMITPVANYHVSNVVVDVTNSIGPTNSYTFSNVTTNHTIHADFAIDTFTLTATAGSNGTITPSGAITVPYGGGTNFVMTPDPMYYIQDVKIDGVSTGKPTSYTFSNTATNHTIDVSFDNRYALVVSSLRGSPSPSGSNLYTYGTVVDCAVDSPVPNGTTQYVGAGWTGAGSVPSSGSGTNVSVTVTNYSTLTWQWTTNFWLNAAAGPDGSMDGTTGWYAAGTSVTITATASNHYHFVNWTGTVTSASNPLVLPIGQAHSIVANFAIDTYGITAGAGPNGTIAPLGVVQVPFDGSTNFAITPNANCHITNVVVDGVSLGPTNAYTFLNVTNSHTISALFGIDTYTLIVNSSYGTPVPATGTNIYGWNAFLNCRVGGSPVASGMTQYVCTGWTGSGSVPLSGTTTNTAWFNLLTNSTITWNWQTQYRLSATNGLHGTVTASNGWYGAGTPGVTLSATPSNTYHFVNWTGDLVSTNNPLVLTMNQGYSLTANFAINTYDITATAGPNGSIAPSGVVTVTHGAATNFTITPSLNCYVSNVVVDGTAIGRTNNYVFGNITNNHTISAAFAVTTCTLIVRSPFGISTPPTGTNAINWNAALTCVLAGSPVLNGTTQYACNGWIGSGSVPAAGAGTTVSFTITTNSTLAWQWGTNYWLAATAGPNGAVSTAGGWISANSNVTISAIPDPGYWFSGWTGDVPYANRNDNPLVLSMSQPRAIGAGFDTSPYYVSLNGRSVWPYGSWADAATNIQDAVNAAPAGRVVVVADGTYTLSSPISITNGIIVQSFNGAASTVVSGNGVTRCLKISHSNAVVTGFTIRNGSTTGNGGGVWIDRGGTLQNCTVSGNAAGNNKGGGGVYCSSGGVVRVCTISGNTATYGGGVQCDVAGTVSNNTISGNTASYGGGIRLRLGGTALGCVVNGNTASAGGGGVQVVTAGTVQNCTVYDNSSSSIGGGVYCYLGGTVKGSAIYNNDAALYGGGVQCEQGGIVEDCTIGGNQAQYGGGVRFKDGGSALRCVITNNVARYGGGLQYANSGSALNCLVSGNVATNGGGVYCYSGGAVQNCTVSGNSATTKGGGLYCELGGALANAIIYFNTSPNGANYFDSGPGMSYLNSCTVPLHAGSGNIASDPMFVSLASGNVRLQSGSPCVDAGSSLTGVTPDLDGTPRPLDGNGDSVARWDMGAYELASSVGDTDHDGMMDAGELIAGTDPTRIDSVLGITSFVLVNGNATLAWQGGVTATQYIDYCTDLLRDPITWIPAFTVNPPTAISTNLVITGVTNADLFFRVRAAR